MNLKVSLMCAVLSHAGCAPLPIVPVVYRPAQVVRVFADGKTPLYVECIEKGRRLLRQGRVREAEAWLSCAAHAHLVEVPNFDSWLELAEVKCRVGKLDEAIAWIDDFEMAMRIIDDTLPCHEPYHLTDREMPNPDLTPRVYTEMCPVINWYAGLSRLPLLERLPYEA